MIEPKLQNIGVVIGGLANGNVSRQQAVEWGKTVRERLGVVYPGVIHFETDIPSFFHIWAVIVSALLNEDGYTTGAPYFIRECDFQEWDAFYRCEDLPKVLSRSVWPIRSHQVHRLAEPALACFDMTVEEIKERTALRDVRGLDDLDYYAVFLFEATWGEQYMFESRPRAFPTQQVVYIDSRSEEPRLSLEKILPVLGLIWEDLTWISPALT